MIRRPAALLARSFIQQTCITTSIILSSSVSPTLAKQQQLPTSTRPLSTTKTNNFSYRGKMGGVQTVKTDLPETNSVERPDKVRLSEKEWKERLTSEQFHVCRRKGTEPAWSNDLLDNKAKGVYYCAACGADLFSSSSKFDSGSGWPSFFDAIKDTTSSIPNVEVHVDRTHGMERTEILCGKCDSHLGHVFNDGPAPTGLRFCVNGASLKFRKEPNSEL